MCHFWVHLPQTNFFWKKIFISFSSTYWLLSLCKISKKFFKQIQSYDNVPSWGPKWPICPNENFFIKDLLISLIPFINTYLHAKNQSQIYLLMKYWQLKNTEISLAESHFGYNLGTRFFPSMQFLQNVNEP